LTLGRRGLLAARQRACAAVIEFRVSRRLATRLFLNELHARAFARQRHRQHRRDEEQRRRQRNRATNLATPPMISTCKN
jgi:hypothetical protein